MHYVLETYMYTVYLQYVDTWSNQLLLNNFSYLHNSFKFSPLFSQLNLNVLGKSGKCEWRECARSCKVLRRERGELGGMEADLAPKTFALNRHLTVQGLHTIMRGTGTVVRWLDSYYLKKNQHSKWGLSGAEGGSGTFNSACLITAMPPYLPMKLCAIS